MTGKLEKAIQELSAEIADSNAERVQLIEGFEHWKNKYEDEAAELAKSRAKILELERSLNDKRTEVVELQEALARTKRQLEEEQKGKDGQMLQHIKNLREEAGM